MSIFSYADKTFMYKLTFLSLNFPLAVVMCSENLNYIKYTIDDIKENNRQPLLEDEKTTQTLREIPITVSPLMFV